MKTDQLIKEYLDFQNKGTAHSLEVIKELISYRANEKDDRINNQLLKKTCHELLYGRKEPDRAQPVEE